MKKSFFILVLLSASLAFGQGVFVPPQTAFKVVNGYTTPIANATITVCAALAGGIPCSPPLTSTIFKDVALTQPLSNPFTSDAFGNYQFAIAAGTYTVSVTAAGFAGNSYQISVGSGGGGSFIIPNPLNAVNLNVSGATNVTGLSSAGPINVSTPVFPAIGLFPDPFCAYMVNPQSTGNASAGLPNLQVCAFADPNNGFAYLAINDGEGSPNFNQFVMPFNTLGSFQPKNSFGVWNPTLGGFDYASFPTLCLVTGTSSLNLPICASQQGTGTKVQTAGTVAASQPVGCTDATGAFTTTGCRPQTFYLTSAFTNATTSQSSGSGGGTLPNFAVAANAKYTIQCFMTYQVDTSSATPNWQWTGPASPTAVLFDMQQANISATTALVPMITITAFSTPSAQAGTQPTTTNIQAILNLRLLNGANAGTVQLQEANHGAGTLTIQPGSSCVLN